MNAPAIERGFLNANMLEGNYQKGVVEMYVEFIACRLVHRIFIPSEHSMGRASDSING